MTDWKRRNARTLLRVFQEGGLARSVRLVDYRGEDLSGATFSSVEEFDGADFSGAILTNATFQAGGDLRNASFRGATMRGARLDHVDLRGADFTDAQADEVSLIGADLRGARLRGVSLRRARLVGARTDGDFEPAWGMAGPQARLRTNVFPSGSPTAVAWVGAPGGTVTLGGPVPGGDLIAIAWEGATLICTLDRGLLPVTMLGDRLGVVKDLAWSQDGTRLATNGRDGATIWDPTAAAVVHRLGGKSILDVGPVAWTRDGRRLATPGDRYGTVSIWDTETGALVTTFEATTLAGLRSVIAVAWSPDGARLATGTTGHTAEIWDVQAPVIAHTLRGHTDWVRSVTWSPDGARLATASDDQTVRVWDTRSGAEVGVLKGHTRFVRSIAWSPDGTRLVSVGDDPTIRVWDTTDLVLSRTLTGNVFNKAVCWSPDGSKLLTASVEGARVWDTTTGTAVSALIGTENDVMQVLWSPIRNHLAIYTYDGTVRCWDTVSATTRVLIQGEFLSGTTWLPDGTLMTATDGGILRRWDVETGRAGKIAEIPPDTMSALMTWSEDGLRVTAVDAEGNATVLSPGRPATSHALHAFGRLRAGSWSPDGSRFAAMFEEGSVRVWGGEKLQQRLDLDASAIAWSPDGRRIAAAGTGGIRVWDLTSDRITHRLALTSDRITRRLAFSPVWPKLVWSRDGTLAVANLLGGVTMWNIAHGRSWTARLLGRHNAGRRVGTLELPEARDVAFSANGELLAVASRDSVLLFHRQGRTWERSASLVALPFGACATDFANGHFRSDGDAGGYIWWSAGLCRFERGELDGIGIAPGVSPDT